MPSGLSAQPLRRTLGSGSHSHCSLAFVSVAEHSDSDLFTFYSDETNARECRRPAAAKIVKINEDALILNSSLTRI